MYCPKWWFHKSRPTWCLNLDKMPILLLIFLSINSTWCFQLRCESIITPRYLIQYSLFNCLLYKRRLKLESCNLFWGGWKSMKFDFSFFLSASKSEKLLTQKENLLVLDNQAALHVLLKLFWSYHLTLVRFQFQRGFHSSPYRLNIFILITLFCYFVCNIFCYGFLKAVASAQRHGGPIQTTHKCKLTVETKDYELVIPFCGKDYWLNALEPN